MPSAKDRASKILGERAEDELVGKAVVLTGGKAGTVESLILDNVHGLRVTIAGHDGAWPVSTIMFLEREGARARPRFWQAAGARPCRTASDGAAITDGRFTNSKSRAGAAPVHPSLTASAARAAEPFQTATPRL